MATDNELTTRQSDQALPQSSPLETEPNVASGRLESIRVATSGVKELNILIALMFLCALVALLSPVFFTLTTFSAWHGRFR